MGRNADEAWASRDAARVKFVANRGEDAWNRSTVACGVLHFFAMPVGPMFGATADLLDVLERIAPLMSDIERLLAVPATAHISAPEKPGAKAITTKILRERCATLAGAFAPALAAGEVLSPIVRARTGAAGRHAKLRPGARVQFVAELLRVTPDLEHHPADLVWFAIGWGLERPISPPPAGASRAALAEAAAARAKVTDRWKDALRRWRKTTPRSRGVKSAA